ncbi:MOSC domain-containing protein [Streptomyces griseus]|uniref:MOSC domain-containing protein n=1 Tax=Streptomyces griseus TaxID=1911 RepID=UPI00056B1B88|nr:MOSC N-terminal beta barrel domain-containing protein [Streptomyces griseus]
MARIAELTYYPVKGCAGVTVSEAELTPTGLAYDRRYVITDEAGELRWLWGDPQLALITPELGPDDAWLVLRAPGYGELRVDADPAAAPVELPGRRYGAVDQGEAAAAWVSDVIGAPSRLLRVPPQQDGGPVAANNNRLHIVSRATLGLLNRRLAERDDPVPALPMNRFRPNLVVDGWDDPHTEDRARRLTVAGMELTHAGATVRCAITMVDQHTGRRAGPEPLRTLATYRKVGGGIVFGAYFAIGRTGKLSVGDEVSVAEWRTPEPV